MDENSRAVHNFLIAMQPVREAFSEFVGDLYKRPEVKLTTVYHPLAYQSSDFGVSAELRSGAVLDFWIELEVMGDFWNMTFSVQRHDREEDGSHSEAEFPPQKIELAGELPRAILAAIQALRQKIAVNTLFR